MVITFLLGGLRRLWFLHTLMLAAFFIGLGGCGGEGAPTARPVNSALQNVFGADDRMDVLSDEYPWSSIGYLGSGCTATLVGNYLALTAAHCVYDSASKSLRAEAAYFYPKLRGGLAQRGVPLRRVWFGSTQPEKDRRADWAVVELARPLGRQQGYLSLGVIDFAKSLPYQISVAGYSEDRGSGQVLSFAAHCAIRRIVLGGRHLHDCDATSGVSGGPVLVMNGRQPLLVGISVSEYRHGAEGSLFRPNYADLYANVAISASAVYQTWYLLKTTIDDGRSLAVRALAPTVVYGRFATEESPAK